MSPGTVIGAGTRTQAAVFTGPGTTIGEEVRIGPRVTFVGDPTMGRRDSGIPHDGVTVGRRVRIGTGATLSPPINIGEEAFIGAGSFVRTDVAPRTVVVGTPARFLRHVRPEDLDAPGEIVPVDRDHG